MNRSPYDPVPWNDSAVPNDEDKEQLKSALAQDNDTALKEFIGRFGSDALNALLFRDNITPLMYASGKGATDCLRILIAQGADLNATDIYGRNACYHAAMENKPAPIPMLALAGADINAFNAINYNPILVAAHNGRGQLFKTLLDCGADIDVVINDATGLTLDDLVKSSTNSALPGIFETHKAELAKKKIADSARMIEKACHNGISKSIPIRKFKPR